MDVRTSFHVLRFMLALKTARDWGLPEDRARSIALRFDPQRRNGEELVDALASALLEERAVRVPDAV